MYKSLYKTSTRKTSGLVERFVSKSCESDALLMLTTYTCIEHGVVIESCASASVARSDFVNLPYPLRHLFCLRARTNTIASVSPLLYVRHLQANLRDFDYPAEFDVSCEDFSSSAPLIIVTPFAISQARFSRWMCNCTCTTFRR
jgi:hypothetical protein